MAVRVVVSVLLSLTAISVCVLDNTQDAHNCSSRYKKQGKHRLEISPEEEIENSIVLTNVLVQWSGNMAVTVKLTQGKTTPRYYEAWFEFSADQCYQEGTTWPRLVAKAKTSERNDGCCDITFMATIGNCTRTCKRQADSWKIINYSVILDGITSWNRIDKNDCKPSKRFQKTNETCQKAPLTTPSTTTTSTTSTTTTTTSAITASKYSASAEDLTSKFNKVALGVTVMIVVILVVQGIAITVLLRTPRMFE